METHDLQISRNGQWPILKYTVRNRKPRCSFATVFIDDESGTIVIDTDFDQQDTYSYCWSKQGRGTETLREFLVKTNEGYLKDKFSYGRSRWSVKQAQQDLIEKAKELGFNEFDMMDLETLFEEELSSNPTSNEFAMALMNSDVYSKFDPDWLFDANIGGLGANEKTIHMVDTILVPLREFWKEELKTERGGVDETLL